MGPGCACVGELEDGDVTVKKQDAIVAKEKHKKAHRALGRVNELEQQFASAIAQSNGLLVNIKVLAFV